MRLRLAVLVAIVLAAMPAVAHAATTGVDWLDEINHYREASGLADVADQPAWDLGIAHHLTYLRNTDPSLMTGQYASAHTENPASPYYTADGATEAASSDLAEGGATSAVGAIDIWLGGPFHAIGMLRAQLTHVAFGRDAQTGSAGLDVIQGIDGGQPRSSTPVLFPGPGMTTGLSRYGGEFPDPLETCGWSGRSGVGLGLIAMLPAAPAAGVSAELHNPDGSTQTSAGGQLCVVDELNYSSSDAVYGPTGKQIIQGEHAVLIFPATALAPGAHTAVIHQPAQPDITWTFTEAGVVVPPPGSGSGAGSGGGSGTGATGPGSTTVPGTKTTTLSRPKRPSVRRSRTHVVITWHAVTHAHGYRVTLTIAGRSRTISTRARRLVITVSRHRSVRVTVQAVDASGHRSAASSAVVLHAARSR